MHINYLLLDFITLRALRTTVEQNEYYFLGIEDLNDIILEVSDLASNRLFGLALGVRAPDLDRIDEEENKVDMKLQKTISLYLKQNYDVQRYGLPNWKNVVSAVFLSNRRLARDIAAKHKCK